MISGVGERKFSSNAKYYTSNIIQPILYKQYYINEFLFKVRTHFLYAIKTYNSYSFSKPVSIINVATWAALSGSIG